MSRSWSMPPSRRGSTPSSFGAKERRRRSYNGTKLYGDQAPSSKLQAPEKLQTSSSKLRSEEHTSELQSPDHLVCRLLLEKKKTKKKKEKQKTKKTKRKH